MIAKDGSVGERLISDYLARVESAVSGLPPARREELLEQVREHLDDALPPDARHDEVRVRTTMDRLGSPADIAAEARRTFADETGTSSTPARLFAPPSRVSSGLQDVGAMVLLLFGGVLFVVGWGIGLVLLWTSRTWNVRDKLIGTFILPGGLLLALAMPLFVVRTTACITTSVEVVSPAEAPSAGTSTSSRPDAREVSSETSETCDDSGTPGAAVALLIFAFVAPIGSVSYLGWRRSRAIAADARAYAGE